MLSFTVEDENLDKKAKTLITASNRFIRSQNALIQRLTENVKETRALHDVVKRQYRVHNFDTLQFGYDPKLARKDPSRNERWVYETRIYCSGWNRHNLRGEVRKEIIANQPRNIKQTRKECMVNQYNKQVMKYDVTWDRSMTFASTLKHFQEAKKDHDYRLKYGPPQIPSASRQSAREKTEPMQGMYQITDGHSTAEEGRSDI